MKNRRTFVMTIAAALMALAVVVAPVLADELLGFVTKVDVENKKLTVVEKGSDKEVEITTKDDTEVVTGKGSSKIDLAKLSKGVTKAVDAGKKGTLAKIIHEDKVASKIFVGKKAVEKSE
ncbi:MAG: hypothetical protein P4L84_11855 [Isosphaeraceae bacterium]|nr:hypothetical protein [Isosphaeraceae bacterium]